MVKSKFAFLQVKIKSMFLQASKTNQASFGKAPKTLYPVDVGLVACKLIGAVFNTKMFLIPKIHESIIAAPTITVNNAFQGDVPPYYTLESCFRAIGNNFSIDSAISLEQSKNNRFAACATPPDPLDPASSKIAFINFNFPTDRRFLFTKSRNTLAKMGQEPVDGIAINARDGSDLEGIQIYRKKPNNLPDFSFRNFCVF